MLRSSIVVNLAAVSDLSRTLLPLAAAFPYDRETVLTSPQSSQRNVRNSISG